jgi:Spy/CpxP family protein refolding chaperone
MKSRSIMTTLLAAALVGGLYGSASADPPPNPWGVIVNERGPAAGAPDEMLPPAPVAPGEMRTPRGKMPPPCFQECVKILLDLTVDQKKRISELLLDERKKSLPLLKQEAEERRQLHQSERAASFDESAIRTGAGSLAQIETELIVLRARTNAGILSVLTPEQRRLTDKFEQEKGLPGPYPGHMDRNYEEAN